MFSSFIIESYIRDGFGKRYCYKLRNTKKTPGIIYGRGVSIPVYLDENDLKKIYNSDSNIISVRVNSDVFTVIVKDIMVHPYKKMFLHFDFQKIFNDDYIDIKIPINVIGSDDSVGIKSGGVLIKHVSYLKVKSNVDNIPKFLDIDISNLSLNKTLYLSDICFPKNLIVSSLSKVSNNIYPIVSIVQSKFAVSSSSK